MFNFGAFAAGLASLERQPGIKEKECDKTVKEKGDV